MMMYSTYWFPEHKDEKTVQAILKEGDTLVLASFSTSTNEVTAFSHSQIVKTPFGDRIDIHHHGNDLSDLISHVTMNLRHLLEVAPNTESFAMFLLFSKEIPVESVEEALSALGACWISKNIQVKESVGIVEDC